MLSIVFIVFHLFLFFLFILLVDFRDNNQSSKVIGFRQFEVDWRLISTLVFLRNLQTVLIRVLNLTTISLQILFIFRGISHLGCPNTIIAMISFWAFDLISGVHIVGCLFNLLFLYFELLNGYIAFLWRSFFFRRYLFNCLIKMRGRNFPAR